MQSRCHQLHAGMSAPYASAMRRAMRRWALPGCAVAAVVVGSVLGGCGGQAQPDTRPAATGLTPFGDAIRSVPQVYKEVLPGQTLGSDDKLLCNVDVMHVLAPARAISGDADFWTIATDRTLSPEQQRLLETNGVRAGLVELTAWPKLGAMINTRAGVTSRTTNIRGTTRAEVDPIDSTGQTLFYYDRTGALVGRSFDECENFWGMSFVPQTQGRASVRLALCPVVRAQRQRIEVSRAGNESEVRLVRPEAIYELGLTLDIPVGTVLVLAPAARGLELRTSIGRAFLTEADATELHERVYVIYPRMYRLERADSDNAPEAKAKAKPE